MSKHTRGPWAVLERPIPHYMGGVHTERMIFTTWDHPQLKGPLCIVGMAIGAPEKEGDSWVHFCQIREAADAQLIAAAPDLLEALKGVLAILEGPTPPAEEVFAAMDRARAAIAKAENAQQNLRSNK